MSLLSRVLSRKLNLVVALPLLTLWLGGCVTASPVAIDYDPQADFAAMRSYCVLDPLADGPVSPLEIKRASQAVDGLLRGRYVPASNAESADFLVRVQMLAVERVAVYEDQMSIFGGYQYFGFGWQAPLQVRQYREASLVVDVLSPQFSPLWRGSMLSSAGRYSEPEYQHQRMREEAALILNRFPPY
jgi:hypothetical protein